MPVATVDRIRRHATAVRQAVRDLLAHGSQPSADRARWLGVADALDRVLLSIAGDSEPAPPEPRLLVASSRELRAAAAHAGPLLGNDLSKEIDRLCGWLDDRAAKLAPPATRGGSSPTDGESGPAMAPNEGLPISEAIEPVRFGASAPERCGPGECFVARFVAYAPGDARVAAEALQGPGRPTQVVGIGPAGLARGSHLSVVLCGKGLRIEGGSSASQAFVWEGDCIVLQFEVEIPARTRMASTVLKFDVQADGLVIGRVRLELAVRGAASRASLRHSLDQAPMRSAFASYSSQDRARVLDRVAAIRIALGVRVFLDCHDLQPGEQWEPALAREIDACETFILFWSAAASGSRWVTWEWQRALDAKGLEGIQIHPLENGIAVPRALESVHVGDPYMDLRLADAARRRVSQAGPQEAMP